MPARLLSGVCSAGSRLVELNSPSELLLAESEMRGNKITLFCPARASLGEGIVDVDVAITFAFAVGASQKQLETRLEARVDRI